MGGNRRSAAAVGAKASGADMPYFVREQASIHYERAGDGFPALLLAPGGMKSAIGFWANAPWNPMRELAGDFHVIAMDQRNAGRSKAPVAADDAWRDYRQDQLALMDHLGIERFLAVGMCIGAAYALALAEAAPERVAAAVLMQPIGLQGNRDAFHKMFDAWADGLPDGEQPDDETLGAFRRNMFGGDFVFSVSRAAVADMATPLLVLQGGDLYHPEFISREVAALARNAELVERWKEPEHQAAAQAQVQGFLLRHSGHPSAGRGSEHGTGEH